MLMLDGTRSAALPSTLFGLDYFSSTHVHTSFRSSAHVVKTSYLYQSVSIITIVMHVYRWVPMIVPNPFLWLNYNSHNRVMIIIIITYYLELDVSYNKSYKSHNQYQEYKKTDRYQRNGTG